MLIKFLLKVTHMRLKISLPARLTALVPNALACVLVLLAGFVASGRVWTQEPSTTQEPAQQQATPTQQTPPTTDSQQQPATTPADGQQPATTPPTPTTDQTQQPTTAPTDATQQQPTTTDGTQQPAQATEQTVTTTVPPKTDATNGKGAKVEKKPQYKQVKAGPRDAEDIAAKDPDGESLLAAGPFSEPDSGEGKGKARRTTEITEEELKALLLKQQLFLRGGYLNDTLSFNERGGLVGKSPQGSYTLSSVEITKITITKHKIILEGDRFGLHFLGAIGETDEKNIAMIKLTPPKHKKPLSITIDREVVVKPPKMKEIKEEKPKPVKSGKGKGKASAAAGVPCATPTAAPATAEPATAAPADGTTPAPATGETQTTPTTDATTTAPADGQTTAAPKTDEAPATTADGTAAAPKTDATKTDATGDGTATPTTTADGQTAAPKTDATTTEATPATQTPAAKQTAPPCDTKPAAEETVAATPTPEVKPGDQTAVATPASGEGVAKPGDKPELTPEEQARAEVAASIASAKPEERPADPNSVTHTYSNVHASRVLRQALDRIFSVGLDSREMDSMPDLWKHYYEAQENKSFYRFKDPNLVKLSQVERKPTMLKGVEPESNAYAQENGIVGIARYRAVIGPDGLAGDVAITVPIGFGLDENAATAIRKSVFKPAIKDGQPVTAAIDLFITFRIFSKLTTPVAGKKDEAVQVAPVKPAPKPGPYTLIHPSRTDAAPLTTQPDTSQPAPTAPTGTDTTGTTPSATADTALPTATTAPTTTTPTSAAPAIATPTAATTVITTPTNTATPATAVPAISTPTSAAPAATKTVSTSSAISTPETTRGSTKSQGATTSAITTPTTTKGSSTGTTPSSTTPGSTTPGTTPADTTTTPATTTPADTTTTAPKN
jgi:hypothetical protein